MKGYTYKLKQAVTGVSLDVSNENMGQVSSIEAASGVVVVATKDGNSIDSKPIEFVIIELTKPVVSATRVRTGQVATFPKVLGHTYELKEEKTGVALTEATGGNRMRITATQAASDVIIVATLDGNTEESDPIEFVLIELTKPALSATRVKVGTPITFPKKEAHTYALKQAVTGVELSDVTRDTTKKQVSSTEAATGVVIVATLDGITSESDPVEFVEITKPVFNQKSAPWNTPITFPKEPGYTYELKEEKTGVALTEARSGDTMEVTATQSAQNVIIVATDNGLSAESDPIEFTRQQGNTLSFAQTSRTARRSNVFTEAATKSDTVAGDTRNIRYSIRPSRKEARIHSTTGKVSIWKFATGFDYNRFTITAELQQTAKYERSTATYTLVIR